MRVRVGVLYSIRKTVKLRSLYEKGGKMKLMEWTVPVIMRGL